MNRFKVGLAADFQEGTKKRVVVDGNALMVAFVEGSFYIISDTCTHAQSSLSGGKLDGFCIECPWHGAKFDIRDGHVVALPAAIPVRTYKVQLENGEVWVEID